MGVNRCYKLCSQKKENMKGTDRQTTVATMKDIDRIQIHGT